MTGERNSKALEEGWKEPALGFCYVPTADLDFLCLCEMRGEGLQFLDAYLASGAVVGSLYFHFRGEEFET